jgi:hypothetical protein
MALANLAKLSLLVYVREVRIASQDLFLVKIASWRLTRVQM